MLCSMGGGEIELCKRTGGTEQEIKNRLQDFTFTEDFLKYS